MRCDESRSYVYILMQIQVVRQADLAQQIWLSRLELVEGSCFTYRLLAAHMALTAELRKIMNIEYSPKLMLIFAAISYSCCQSKQ